MERRLNQVFVTLISVKTTRKKNEKERKRAGSKKKIVIPAFFLVSAAWTTENHLLRAGLDVSTEEHRFQKSRKIYLNQSPQGKTFKSGYSCIITVFQTDVNSYSCNRNYMLSILEITRWKNSEHCQSGQGRLSQVQFGSLRTSLKEPLILLPNNYILNA